MTIAFVFGIVLTVVLALVMFVALPLMACFWPLDDPLTWRELVRKIRVAMRGQP